MIGLAARWGGADRSAAFRPMRGGQFFISPAIMTQAAVYADIQQSNSRQETPCWPNPLKIHLPCELQETNMIQSFSWKSYLIHPTARFCFCRLIFLLSFPLSWLQWRAPARRDLMHILTSGILNDTVVYEKSGEPLSEASIWILSSTTSRKGGLFSYCTFFTLSQKNKYPFVY